jgi:hypothetical protein
MDVAALVRGHWKAYLQVDSQSERAGYARRQIG